MTSEEYLQRLGLTKAEIGALLEQYQFSLTAEMKSAIQAFSPSDPIVAQFFPDPRENLILPTELSDPIGDKPHSPLDSLVHRYPNRVLWKITPVCAVYCRFCFRKEHIGRKGQALKKTDILAVEDYLLAHPEVEEVIFSGGDPLSLTVKKLIQCSDAFAHLPHIARLRIHSRIPIVAPERITPPLLNWLAQLPQTVCLVIHANHANEITPKAAAALKQLRQHGVLLFSQTVLLKGVNAHPKTLANLMNTFLKHGVTPYYLHHLDLAKGTNHFRVSLAEGLDIERQLRESLSGIAMPTYIVEIPNGGGKIPVRHLSAEQRATLNDLGIY